MMQSITLWLENIAQSTPLPLFVLIGGLVEEIIAPLPSPLVSAFAGGITESQGLGIPYLLFICLLLTASKTVGAWLFYKLGDVLEDVAVPRFGKYIGVSHQEVERFGSYFQGRKRDLFVLLFLRAIPVMPSTPISLVCGILKIPTRTFLIASFGGFYVRNLCFMILGYTGLSAIGSLMHGIDTAETVLKIGIVILAVGILAWLYWRRSKGKPIQLDTLRADK